MPIQPALLTSGGTQFQFTVLPFGKSIPDEITITVTAAAVVGATTLTVTVAPATGVTLYAGLVLRVGTTAADSQWVILTDKASGTITNLKVEPLQKAIVANAIIKTYAGLPLIGLEGANLQLQTETNQAVLLANDGWQSRDYSTGSFEFSGNLYIPTSGEYALGAYAVADALLAKKNIYVERILPDGTYHAGMCIVSNCSDQTQGAAYITQSLTLSGSGKPVQRRLPVA